jgi:S-DNA-T family DNA segregation ATPase FtsK/SpoIIIE
MVDPKRVELTGYNGIPHLVAPVVVDVERIIGVLKWLTREMDDRYKKFSVAGARNIEDFNRNRAPDTDALPYIVAIIDELADLMMLAPEEAERYITRVAAMARATGIHLVIATQRPSADVVTGLIKANFPARIAFAVAGNVDSRVILDQPGAEKLLGRGDMLYLSADSPSAQRLQGVFVSDSELNSIIRYWKAQAADNPQKPMLTFGSETEDKPVRASQQSPAFARPAFNQPQQQEVLPRGLFDDLDDEDNIDDDEDGGGADDDLFERAVELVRRQNGASVSLLQRKMRIGYARAARLIDAMEDRGIVGPQKEGSSKQRDVLIPK